jgi:Carboxypeptidase regulatory-like domain
MARTPSPLRLLLTAGLVALLTFKASTWLQTAAVPPNPVGSATVEGVVVDDLAQPIAGAALTLSFDRSNGGRSTWSASADERGRFAITKLPGGIYTLQAQALDHVSGYFTEMQASWSRTPIDLGDDGHMRDVRVRIARAAAISGVVRDSAGAPLARHTVRAERMGGGGLQAFGTSVTDAAGHYEIRGLESGDYLLAVREPELPYTSLYYPAARRVSAAQPVTLGVAERRPGVDIRVPAATVSTVEGALERWDAGAPRVATIEIFDRDAADGIKYWHRRTVRSDATGRLAVPNLAAGHYLFVAQASGAASAHYSGSVAIDLDAAAPSPVRIPLSRGAAISGFVRRDDSPAPHVPLRLTGADVETNARLGFQTRSAATAEDGSFRFTDVPAGRYRITAAIDVAVMTVQAPGRPDGVIQIGRADVPGVGVRIALRSSQLSGVVHDATGHASGAGVVLALLANADSAGSSARLQVVMPSTSGRFVFDRLPAGEFDVIAVTSLAPALDDLKALEALRPRATRVVIKDGEQKRLDLTLR